MQIHVDAAAHFSAFKRSLRLLRTPRFGTYYVATLLSNIGTWSQQIATLLSNIGTWSQQIAEPWLLLSLGASSFLIGLDAFVQAAPAWMLILAGGILADRADRRIVITTFQAIQMLCPIILVALLLTNSVEPWMVVVLSLVVLMVVSNVQIRPSFRRR
jgi:nitrate/nitrite transporter NarK